MANTIMNEIRVEGTRADIRRIRERLFTGEGKFSFSALVPEERGNEEWFIDPATLNLEDESTRPDGKVFNWYGFREKHWGPHWDATDCDVVNDEPTYIELRFDTAWSCAGPWYDRLVAEFPGVTIDYRACDEAMDWYYENGNTRRISEMVDKTALKRAFIEENLPGYDTDRLLESDAIDWYCVTVPDLFDQSSWYMEGEYDEENLSEYKKK